MTYRVEFDGAALVQLNGLPSAAFDGLVQRVVALVEAPWDADLMAPGEDPAERQATFGEGYGLLSFPRGRCRRVDSHLRHRLDWLAYDNPNFSYFL
jgi:hypothetical protein